MQKNIIFKILIFVFIFGFAANAEAASLYFSPSSGTYSVGQNITMNVLVSSTKQAVNAYSGEISYPADKMTLLSISKTGSIVNFWSTDPKGGGGLAHFEGITVDPGYTGSSGRIITATFRAIASGSALVKFSSSSVLANDGLGTSVLEGTGTALFTIQGEKKIVEVPTVTPALTSTTHPDQDAWYSLRVAEVDWDLPSGVTNVSYTTNANPNGLPYAYFGLVKSRLTPSLNDGVWYTHVRFKTANGVGPVANFKTQIDGTAPDFVDVLELNGGDDSFKKLGLTATDALSGISGFGISIDGGEEKFVEAIDGKAEFTTSTLVRGAHNYVVKAYDKAKNYLEKIGSFEITHLDSPVITEYEKTLREGDFLVVRGTTYKDMNVEVDLMREIPVKNGIFGSITYVNSGEPITGKAVSDHNGDFVFAYSKRLEYGRYKVSARVVIDGGVSSAPSEEIIIPVTQIWYLKIIRMLQNEISIMVILILLVILFTVAFVRKYQKYHNLKSSIGQMDGIEK